MATPEEPEHEREQVVPKFYWIPRAPRTGSIADYVVIIFTLTVAFLLTVLTTGLVVASFVGDSKVAPYFAVITDIMTTLIGSLIGYLAGKGQGRREAENGKDEV